MEEHVNPQVYCIFSNDIGWCESNLHDLLPGKEIVYVDWNKGTQSYADMQLMSLCKHNVIANSSFSWWDVYIIISVLQNRGGRYSLCYPGWPAGYPKKVSR